MIDCNPTMCKEARKRWKEILKTGSFKKRFKAIQQTLSIDQRMTSDLLRQITSEGTNRPNVLFANFFTQALTEDEVIGNLSSFGRAMDLGSVAIFKDVLNPKGGKVTTHDENTRQLLRSKNRVLYLLRTGLGNDWKMLMDREFQVEGFDKEQLAVYVKDTDTLVLKNGKRVKSFSEDSMWESEKWRNIYASGV